MTARVGADHPARAATGRPDRDRAESVPLRVSAGKTAVPELPAEFTPRPLLGSNWMRRPPIRSSWSALPPVPGRPCCWPTGCAPGAGDRLISLDRDDNDPRRLWSAVVAALVSLPSASRDGGLERIAQLAMRPGAVDLVDELADALDGLDPAVRVVLDDVHELTGQEVLRDLVRLIRRRPAGLRLVLASRTDPPISIPPTPTGGPAARTTGRRPAPSPSTTPPPCCARRACS